MTIASEIARLQGVKADILGAIAEKKVDVPTGAMLADAPDLIRSIKSGINVKIGQGVYPAVKIGNQLWLARNLDEELGTLGVDEWYYNGRSEKTRLNSAYTFTASTGTYRDDNVTLFDNALDYIRNVRNTNIHAYFKVSLSAPAPIDIPLVVYVNESDSSYIRVGSATIPQGSTEGIIDSYAKIQTTSTKNYVRTFIRVGVTTGKIEPTITYTWICRLNFGTTDCGENAITYEQALANEATAKANNYGRLYTFNTILNNISKLGLTKWRWPTQEDFDRLIALDPTGKDFRAKTWSGTDIYGMNVFPTGTRSDEGAFSGITGRCVLWSNEKQNTNSKFLDFQSNSFAVRNSSVAFGRSLRLVMDLNEDGTIPDSNIVLDDVPATTAEPLALASEPIVTEEEE